MQQEKMTNPSDAGKTEGRKGRKRAVKIALVILALILLALLMHQCGVYKFPWEKRGSVVAGNLFPGQGKDANDGHLNNMTPEEIKAQMQRVADASQFSFKINARPTFADGSAKGNLGIENPNYNVYPMTVQIFLDNNNEKVYDSGGLLPNQHIDNAKLLKVLKAGTYKATAVLNAYDPDTRVWQGKAHAELKIIVKN
ncbi:MAG: hypothetical protein FWC54_04040 [Actinomycetia bacterium]|nr:hypothetical protein [Actinomycetes bacterium]